jgi:hypothetical protein
MKLTAGLPLVALGLALTAVVITNDQQAQQTFINAAIGALAIRAGSSPNRRSTGDAGKVSTRVAWSETKSA